MIKPDKSQMKAVEVSGIADEAFKGKYPLITAYLMDGTWDDGSSRETSAISFTIKDGMWQLALNDKALKTSAYTTAPTMQACLVALEKALAGGQVGWRPWKRGK